MKKRITIVFALLLTIVMVTGGCSDNKQTAEELFRATMDSSVEMKNYSFDFAGNVNLELPETAGESIPIGVPDSVELSGSGQMDSENMVGYFVMDFNTMGMGLSTELYFDKEEMLVKIPMVGQYMKMNYAEMSQIEGQENFDLQAFYENYNQQEMMQEFMAFVEGKDISFVELFNISDEVKEETVEVNGSKVKTQMLVMNLDKETLKKLLPLYIEFYTKEQLPKLAEALGEEATMEDLDPEEINSSMEELFNLVDIQSMEIKMYIDEDSYVVKEEVNFAMTVIDELDESANTGMNGDFSVTMFDINKTTDIKKPEVDESMIMDYSDMLGTPEY